FGNKNKRSLDIVAKINFSEEYNKFLKKYEFVKPKRSFYISTDAVPIEPYDLPDPFNLPICTSIDALHTNWLAISTPKNDIAIYKNEGQHFKQFASFVNSSNEPIQSLYINHPVTRHPFDKKLIVVTDTRIKYGNLDQSVFSAKTNPLF